MHESHPAEACDEILMNMSKYSLMHSKWKIVWLIFKSIWKTFKNTFPRDVSNIKGLILLSNLTGRQIIVGIKIN